MEKKHSALDISLCILKALLYFGLWLLVQVIVVNFAAIVITAKYPGINDHELTSMINELSVEINIVIGALTVLILAIFAKLRRDTLSNMASINKFPSRFTFTLLIMGIATAYSITLVFGLLQKTNVFPSDWIAVQEQTYSTINMASPFMQFLSVGFIAPLVEEILFRGCILGTLKKKMHPWIAIIISALIFGVAHGTPIGIIYATLLGLLMGWLAVTFNSIVPTLFFHIAYNCTVAYSDGISLAIAAISIPILVFEILSIKNYFRGNNE